MVNSGTWRVCKKVFDGITLIDITLYNAMIVAYLKNGLDETALDYLRKLIWEGLSPNERT